MFGWKGRVIIICCVAGWNFRCSFLIAVIVFRTWKMCLIQNIWINLVYFVTSCNWLKKIEHEDFTLQSYSDFHRFNDILKWSVAPSFGLHCHCYHLVLLSSRNESNIHWARSYGQMRAPFFSDLYQSSGLLEEHPPFLDENFSFAVKKKKKSAIRTN